MKILRFLFSAIQIFIAIVSPAVVGWAQADGWTIREQWFLVVGMLAVALGLHAIFLKHEENEHEIERKKDLASRLLDGIAERASDGQHVLDSDGDLDIRLNVMVPYVRWPGGIFTPAYDRPADKPPNHDVMLLMY